MRDVIVIGGGAIGLAIARELASLKLSVLVIERDVPGQGTSRAAAGMLAPQTEAAGGGPFFDLAMAFQAQGLGLRARKAAEAAAAIDPANGAVQTLLASLRPSEPEPEKPSGIAGFLRRKP